MLNQLHIDIETFSSVDIKSSGAYKYIESPDFEILMVAYAFGYGPIQIVDLLQGESLPEKFLKALYSPEFEKHAHNAVFERQAFKRVGHNIPADQWYCSSVKAAYCGYPLSLEQISKAMGLGDKAKLMSGKRLIRYFSMPCKPTKTNEGRTRNLPEHAPEKWQQFKDYCVQDVEAEREIEKRLIEYKIPEWERQNYLLDQKINDAGILIDLELANKAVNLDEENQAGLTKKLKDITGLDNPNSVAQLKSWIKGQTGKTVESLSKGDIPALIEDFKGHVVSDALKLRQQASKSSTKKYIAMQNCICEDQRAHGVFQHYGANRTGRWAGRLIQLQNLPQNKLEDSKRDQAIHKLRGLEASDLVLSSAREIIKSGIYQTADLIYPNVSSILSQLIRTAFIAPKNQIFAVADFSAIEARVIAWLAREQWRIDVFNSHGKIYEASASMMFNIPIEKITKDLRAKGKVAELALGYQGAVNAMIKMGAEEKGLTEMEMRKIVKAWRRKNPNIVKLWSSIETYALRAIRSGKKQIGVYGLLEFDYDIKRTLMIKLPSGRKLMYPDAYIAANSWGSPCINFMGVDQQTKQWSSQNTYGGKLTENVIQAIARDCLAFSMQNLNDNNYKIVMHVHDEAICEIPVYDSQKNLDTMCEIMGRPIPWAKGLPLKADGYLTPFYKKD